MNNYLHGEEYYIDRYDLHTIEECLKWYWDIKSDFEKHRSDEDFQKYTKKKFATEVHKITSYTVNIIKIQRYRRKSDTIRDWMEKDRKIQEKYDNATPPSNIRCLKCLSSMNVTSKDFLHAYDDNSQVLFMFECVKCKKRQALFEDGTEWQYEPPKCPRCTNTLNHVSKHSKNKLTTLYSCTKCNYKEKDEHDFKKSDEKWKKREERERKLLDMYRKEFCLDEEEGPKAVHSLDSIMRFVDEMKEKEKREKNPVFQQAKKLKQLRASQLKGLMEEVCANEGYSDLQFGKPEMGRHVIIEFTVNDTNESRTENDSKNNLKKLLIRVLEDTTWRLMSDGLQCRLGILTGRLKAYETEDDLINLVKTEK